MGVSRGPGAGVVWWWECSVYMGRQGCEWIFFTSLFNIMRFVLSRNGKNTVDVYTFTHALQVYLNPYLWPLQRESHDEGQDNCMLLDGRPARLKAN